MAGLPDVDTLPQLIVFSCLLGLEFLFSVLAIWDIQVRLDINGFAKRLLYASMVLAWLGTTCYLFDNFPKTNANVISVFFLFCAVFNFIPLLLTYAWYVRWFHILYPLYTISLSVPFHLEF